jgi:hypothetical protein
MVMLFGPDLRRPCRHEPGDQLCPMRRMPAERRGGPSPQGNLLRLHPRRHQLGRRDGMPPPVGRPRAYPQKIVRVRFSSPAFAFVTIPWEYLPGEVRK